MEHGLISAPQPEAVEAGALVLLAGGNAIDAGIACALTQGVVDPLMCGLGGVGTAVIHSPRLDRPENFNFLGSAPLAAHDDIWSDRIVGETGDGFGFILKDNVNALGHQAAMVPGNLAGYWAMHQEFGRLPWADLCQHAIETATEGWMVRPHVYSYATQDEGAVGRVHNSDILGFSQEGRALYLADDGLMHRPGRRIKNPALAESLTLIAADGADALYGGELGRRLCEDMAASGGLITIEDLLNYRVVRAPALTGTYRDVELATNRPGGSGLQVLLALNILEQFDPSSFKFGSPDHLVLLAEALTYAYDTKRSEVGDPAFVDVPVEKLLDKASAVNLAERIRKGEQATLNRLPQSLESKGTTHVSVYDRDGNAFSMTHTLGAPSGVLPPGSGFILNGCMGIFDPRPGRPTSIKPGKSYTSSMSPTIAYRSGSPYIVIGAPGATYIPQAITQAIVNCIDFEMSISDAIAAPRIAVTQSRRIDLSNRIPRFVEKSLSDRGYDTQRSYLSYAFAGVHGIKIDNGIANGAADPGRDGMALTV
ncbi:MAG: gamma-glutamyltransferase family protein [Hyphomicrobiaceae bacterium]